MVNTELNESQGNNSPVRPALVTLLRHQADQNGEPLYLKRNADGQMDMAVRQRMFTERNISREQQNDTEHNRTKRTYT